MSEEEKPFRMGLTPKCNTDDDVVRINLKKSFHYPRVKYGKVMYKPPCAVVGGGPSLVKYLDELRNYPGDIYAINDTAGFLSDNGISCTILAVDCTRYLFKIGPLVKGALFASRVHRKQFNQFDKKNVLVWDMVEDFQGGVQGGPTAVCRTPMLLLRMGYVQIDYFGIDGCFFGPTHVSGTQRVAYDNIMLIRAGGIDYFSNASLVLQSQWMSETMLKHPLLLINRSEGLMKAMLEHNDTWEFVGVGKDLKEKYEKLGAKDLFVKEYNPERHKVWQPQQIL
jgi:hypothetical protein